MKETLRDDLIAVDINAPQGSDLQQFTPEQIDGCCQKLDKMCLAMTSEKTVLAIALQIIRQLQAELNRTVHIDDLSASVFTSPTGPSGQG